jgi:hypothetical protein
MPRVVAPGAFFFAPMGAVVQPPRGPRTPGIVPEAFSWIWRKFRFVSFFDAVSD